MPRPQIDSFCEVATHITIETALTVTSSSQSLAFKVNCLWHPYVFTPIYHLFPTWPGQPFCTPKWPITTKAIWTDGHLNYLHERLQSLFIALSSNIYCIYMKTVTRSCKNKVWDGSVYRWLHLLDVVYTNLHVTVGNHMDLQYMQLILDLIIGQVNSDQFRCDRL